MAVCLLSHLSSLSPRSSNLPVSTHWADETSQTDGPFTLGTDDCFLSCSGLLFNLESDRESQNFLTDLDTRKKQNKTQSSVSVQSSFFCNEVNDSQSQDLGEIWVCVDKILQRLWSLTQQFPCSPFNGLCTRPDFYFARRHTKSAIRKPNARRRCTWRSPQRRMLSATAAAEKNLLKRMRANCFCDPQSGTIAANLQKGPSLRLARPCATKVKPLL